MSPEEYWVLYGDNTEFDCWVTGEKTRIDWALRYKEAQIAYEAYQKLIYAIMEETLERMFKYNDL